MMVDNVDGISTTHKRNPNYWGNAFLFPENQLPYVDSVKVLLIQDASTRYAAQQESRARLEVAVTVAAVTETEAMGQPRGRCSQ